MSEIKTTENTDVALQKNVTDAVLTRIGELSKDGGIRMPEGYNPGNALKMAWFTIQNVQDKEKKPALLVCDRNSIINCLLDMCIQGLSPAKNQCYFIVRGKELTMTRSYFGTVAALKRLNGITDVFAQVIYEGDTFEYEIDNGNIRILKHEQKLENIDIKKIVGAYSVIVKDGTPRAEIMTMDMIRQSWTHRSNKGDVQNEFPDQMAKRTVLNRGAKMYINTSNDSDEIIGAINRTTANEYEQEYQDHEPIYAEPVSVSMPEPETQPASEEKPTYRRPDKASREPGF